MKYAQIKEYELDKVCGGKGDAAEHGDADFLPQHLEHAFELDLAERERTDDRHRLTLLGGEPFEPENQSVLVGLLRKVKRIYPKKTVWCYTGYTYERDLLRGGDKHTSHTDEMLSLIDVLVDGRFLLAEKDITLLYRGSRNQRILALHAAGPEGNCEDSGAVDAEQQIADIAKGDSNWK